MGYYDGMNLKTPQASSYVVAKVTESPAVLVINAKGAALSIMAVIKGFTEFCPDHHIRGVILNRCTAPVYSALADLICEQFQGAILPLGYLPDMPECSLESRRLGLIMPAEVKNLRQKMQRLAGQAERTVCLDQLLALGRTAPKLQCEPVSFPRSSVSVRIAVARDQAFSFYYADNLRLLEELGAQLVFFSPLADSQLPPNIHGLYLGGGYPELYAGKLADNQTMCHAVRQALENGLPCIAECGGFMYLTDRIGKYPMAGYLHTDSFDAGKLTRFGYITLTAQKDSMLCRAGESIAAHEFHHWDTAEQGNAFFAQKPSGRGWSCVVANDHLYAGFPHLHFYADPNLARRFYRACEKEKNRHA